MHVWFIAPSLGLGGAENHLIQYANDLAQHNHHVTILVLGHNTQLKHRLSEDVSCIVSSKRIRNPALWISTARIIKKATPDIVIGWGFWGATVACATKQFHKIRTAVVELNYPPSQQRYSSRFHRLIVFGGIKNIYKYADIVAANSDETTKWLESQIGEGPRYQRVYNPIDFAKCDELANFEIDEDINIWKGNKLLSVGRLVLSHKGFDLLVTALNHIKHLDWTLLIVGTGPDGAALQKLINEANLEKRILLVGPKSNPFPYYRNADLVICPSRFEGFPNVLFEALAIGKATVATNCKSGPNELTCDGSIGFLVPPEDAVLLAQAISELILDTKKRRHLASIAAPTIRKMYTPEKIYSSIENLLSI